MDTNMKLKSNLVELQIAERICLDLYSYITKGVSCLNSQDALQRLEIMQLNLECIQDYIHLSKDLISKQIKEKERS